MLQHEIKFYRFSSEIKLAINVENFIKIGKKKTLILCLKKTFFNYFKNSRKADSKFNI